MTGAGFRDQFADVVRTEPVNLFAAALLIAAAAHPTTAAADAAEAERSISELVARVPPEGQASDRLRAALVEFGGTEADYETLESSLLPDVLRTHHGLPILLSVVWLEVAHRAGIPAFGVGLPGHFVVAVGQPDSYHELLDPFGGGRHLKPHEIGRIVGRTVTSSDLRPWDPLEILQRILANIRSWARRPERLATRRWALEYALALPRHAIDLERQHGEVLAQLGGFREAAESFERYAELIEPADVQASQGALRKARQFRAQLN